MSETEGTTAEDLQAGGAKPGTDYGDPSGIGTVGDATTADAGGDEGRTEGGATPDEPEAERAQEGVQEAFDAH